MSGLTPCPGVAGEGCDSMIAATSGRTRCNICQRDFERLNPDQGDELMTTPAIERRRALEADLVRRSEERAEREQAEADARAKRASKQAERDEAERAALNDAIRQPSAHQAAKQEAWHQRLFGSESEEPEPPDRPAGDADGGRGEAGVPEYEDVMTEDGPTRMRVFDLDKLNDDRKDNDE